MTNQIDSTCESARAIALCFHLETGMPQELPQANKTAMMAVFRSYWAGHIHNHIELQERLKSDAGYLAPLERYGLYTFLNNSEFH